MINRFFMIKYTYENAKRKTQETKLNISLFCTLIYSVKNII